jgi:hypothetical protein
VAATASKGWKRAALGATLRILSQLQIAISGPSQRGPFIRSRDVRGCYLRRALGRHADRT